MNRKEERFLNGYKPEITSSTNPTQSRVLEAQENKAFRKYKRRSLAKWVMAGITITAIATPSLLRLKNSVAANFNDTIVKADLDHEEYTPLVNGIVEGLKKTFSNFKSSDITGMPKQTKAVMIEQQAPTQPTVKTITTTEQEAAPSVSNQTVMSYAELETSCRMARDFFKSAETANYTLAQFPQEGLTCLWVGIQRADQRAKANCKLAHSILSNERIDTNQQVPGFTINHGRNCLARPGQG